MSWIADALKRAQQDRDSARRNPAETGDRPAPGGTLASLVLRHDRPSGEATTEESLAPPTEELATTTPVSDAIRRAPSPPPHAARAQQQADTIVEDYTSKRNLNLPTALAVYHNRAGAVAEQFRKIRDSLMAKNPKREPQVLVFTSARCGEGKTTTTLNLGLSLVEIRANRVLLIDGCLSAARLFVKAVATR